MSRWHPAVRPRLFTWLTLAIGLLGAVVIAVTSYRVGATQQRLEPVPGRHLLRGVVHAKPDPHGRLAYSTGLFLLAAAFLVLGRAILRARPLIGWRAIRATASVWAIPIMFAAPLASRDVWAYAAQGHIYATGHNPYAVSPADTVNAYTNQVDPHWRHSPAPYGPVYMALARLVVVVSGHHIDLAVALLRVVSAIGLVLVLVTLPTLCRRFGARADIALWLVAASPLMLVGILGGSHNDLLMLGLMAVGLWFATNDGPWWRTLVPAGIVTTLGLEVKAPAVLLLAFVPHIWLNHSSAGRKDRERRLALPWAISVVAAAAVVTAAVVRFATGLGFGWARQLNVAESGTALLSVPRGLVLIAKFFKGDGVHDLHSIGKNGTPLVTALSVGLAVLVLVALWLSAVRRPPVPRTAAALLAAVVLSTTVQPWYFCWPLLIAVLLAVPARWAAVIATLSVAFAVVLQPQGRAVFDLPVGAPLLLFMFGISWFVLRGRPMRLVGFIRD